MAGRDAERVIADCDVRAVGALQSLDLRFADVSNRHTARSGRRMIHDFSALYPEHLADQRMEGCWRSSCLSREDFAESLTLLSRGARIQVQGSTPVPLVHGSRSMEEDGYIQSVQRSIAEFAGFDVPSYKNCTISLGWRTQKDAGAESLAVTGLKIVPFFCVPLMSHWYSPRLRSFPRV